MDLTKSPLPDPMLKAYHPALIEDRIYRFWMASGHFAPDATSSRQPFVIIMPPPNVTGELHLGHALTASIQDLLVRWHRMEGDPTLWLPGTDHAGIATQWVVEKALLKEGLSRQELGRKEFTKKVWEWVRTYGDTIDEQHKRLGASCDWSRKSFTLDPGPSRAVRRTFVNLYRKGRIYRGKRIINWCPRCATALSDLEVEHEEEAGDLFHIRYPFVGGGGYLTVVTTRPETMFGDTAVAVHPSDERYQAVVGNRVELPFIGRYLPIIADESINPQFGTGALKVTPGHDPVDFNIGQAHDLPAITVIDSDGRMTDEAGTFVGQDRFVCRKAVVAELQHRDLLEKIEPYRHSIGHCQRCKTVVEPLISRQWFLQVGHHDQTDSIAGQAYRAVQENRIRIIPERFKGVYLNWLENIRDWCLSRQLWWGHRIPVWYCADCETQMVAEEEPKDCSNCGSLKIQQDPDVLDTWFSSALWPHSTLGWPDDTDDYRLFYPTTVMETGYDILFFWVARMIMLGIENTGREPFRVVYLHGLVRDVHGIKMSKTKGNVLDPTQLVQQYGTDALRFGLTTGNAPGNDIRLSESKLEAGRNFANKLWNAGRFVIANLEKVNPESLAGWHDLLDLRFTPKEVSVARDACHRHDRWLMHRLNRTIERVNRYLEAFAFGEAQRAIHDFFWGDFCDWYIEMAKVRFRSNDFRPLRVLAHVMECTLRLLHPFMPFITEELWQNLLRRLPVEGNLPSSIMIARYPKPELYFDSPRADQEVQEIIWIIQTIRRTRTEFRIAPAQFMELIICPRQSGQFIQNEAQVIQALARTKDVKIIEFGQSVPRTQGITITGSLVDLVLPLEGVDFDEERSRLASELADSDAGIARLALHLKNQEFVNRAPLEVVERERDRLHYFQERRQRLEELLNQMR